MEEEEEETRVGGVLNIKEANCEGSFLEKKEREKGKKKGEDSHLLPLFRPPRAISCAPLSSFIGTIEASPPPPSFTPGGGGEAISFAPIKTRVLCCVHTHTQEMRDGEMGIFVS